MSLLTVLHDKWVLSLSAFLLFCILAFCFTNDSRRHALLARLCSGRHRSSSALTPPASILGEKPGLERAGQSSASSTTAKDFTKIFPPSRHFMLSKLSRLILLPEQPIDPEPTADDLVKNLLPSVRSYDIHNDIVKYTPTRFSTAEIKALGNFPDYDILSGIPLPKPYAEFDPTKALPRPYRPFRWAYHQTMALTKMEPDWWLEVENTYVSRIQERKDLFEKHGSQLLDYLPGSELACKELMEIFLQFYCSRYPTYFSLSSDERTFHNGILEEDTDIRSMHPLHVILRNIPEDFGIVLRNEDDGLYYLRAGVICSSLGWDVATKIGKKLGDIHEPIPDYKEKMTMSMDRFFSKMPTDAPIQRGSWGLEIGTPLFMPAGDPHEEFRSYQKSDLTIEECHLRVDWQTLRRLPLSAGIVFNFKAVYTPVTEFRDEPYIPSLLLKILKEGKKSIMEYKNTWHVEHVCIPALEEYEREQVARGLVQNDWVPSTLEESPYYPGWEEKWHRQQGF